MFNLKKIFSRTNEPAPKSIPDCPVSVPLPRPIASYVMTQDGNITIIWNKKAHSISKTHRNYDRIVAVLQNEEFEKLNDLLDIAAVVERQIKGVTISKYGDVLYDGQPVHNMISDKIMEFMKSGLPYKPLANFLSNLMENPSERSRNELYGFLLHGGFPITHDGCFMAYKGIRNDWKDKYTGNFDNSIGSVLEMPREQVDPDSHNHCSVGFHVGTHKYASDFAASDGKLVLVKVNPRDAVSVPTDHDASKLRVCRYEVVEVCEGIVNEALYKPEEIEEDDDYADLDYGDNHEFVGDSDEEEEPIPAKTPKRPACPYCGAKGGKKHAKDCKRPKS